MKKFLTFLISYIFVFSYAIGEVRLGFPGEEHASVGIYVKDLRTGKVIADNDSKKALLPASVMKSITAAAVLTAVERDFKYSTKVYLTGQKSASNPSQWIGNLVIESSGDPTIDSEEFDNSTNFSTEITNALKQKGISSVSGKIIVNEYLKNPGCIPEWEIDDVAWAYGAGLYGFNFHDNYSTYWIGTGETNPVIPNLEISKCLDNGRVDLMRGIFSNHLLVYGSDLNNKKTKVNTTMNNPAEAFRYELESKLYANGIKVENKKIENGETKTLILNHESPTLVEILHEMMVHSHNLFAEAMLRIISPNGYRSDALKKEKNVLESLGVNAAYNKICDGSGLARADRLQPEFVSNVFEAMIKSDKANDYVSLFPVVGKEGTVKKLLSDTPLRGKLAMKSGSMSAVQCFAGFKLDDNGEPTHTVVIFVNAFYCDRASVKSAIEKFLLNTFVK